MQHRTPTLVGEGDAVQGEVVGGARRPHRSLTLLDLDRRLEHGKDPVGGRLGVAELFDLPVEVGDRAVELGGEKEEEHQVGN